MRGYRTSLVMVALMLSSIFMLSLLHSSYGDAVFRIDHFEGWRQVEADVVTISFPEDPAQPVFLWWHTKNDETIYVVQYHGICEYFSPKWEPFSMRRLSSLENIQNLSEDSIGSEKLSRRIQPPYFLFSQASWRLSDVERILDNDGQLIGFTFSLTLSNVRSEPFKYLENNLVIRNRFYFVSVVENSNGITHPLHKAEFKMDFILNSWSWNLDEILSPSHSSHWWRLNSEKQGLALWVNLLSLNRTKLEQRGLNLLPFDLRKLLDLGYATHIKIDKLSVNVLKNATVSEEERPTDAMILRFAIGNETLPGYFRFVDKATVSYHNGTSTSVKVGASYIEAGGYLRLFISYPHFDGGRLEHDPIIGIETPEISASKGLQPLYQVYTANGELKVIRISSAQAMNEPIVLAIVISVSVSAITAYSLRTFRKRMRNR